uniref:Putative secreted protein n=1 Tax=Anopheles marajoara TaxID=58244 RepID=A0A2M4CEF6_9DIPT
MFVCDSATLVVVVVIVIVRYGCPRDNDNDRCPSATEPKGRREVLTLLFEMGEKSWNRPPPAISIIIFIV